MMIREVFNIGLTCKGRVYHRCIPYSNLILVYHVPFTWYVWISLVVHEKINIWLSFLFRAKQQLAEEKTKWKKDIEKERKKNEEMKNIKKYDDIFQVTL